MLDVAGMNYSDARYVPDRELLPRPRHRRHRDLAELDRRQLGTRDGRSARDRRLHLDRLGLPRRDRHRRQSDMRGGDSRPKVAGFSGGFPELTAGAATSTSPAPADPSPTSARSSSASDRSLYIAVGRRTWTARSSRGDAVGVDRLASRSWTWEGSEGAPVAVEVYSDADEVELLLNGEPVGRRPSVRTRPSGPRSAPPTGPVSSPRSPTPAGSRPGAATLSTAGDELVLTAVADRAELSADTRDLAFVDLVLTDGNGRVHNGRDRSVTVTVDGPAVLQALGSGNPANARGLHRGQPPHVRRPRARRRAAHRPWRHRGERQGGGLRPGAP